MCFNFGVKQCFDQELYEFSSRNVFFQVDGVVEMTLIEKAESGVLEP